MRITVKAHCDKYQKRKDGSSALYIRVTIDRKIKLLPLSKYIHSENWDDNAKRIKVVKAEPKAKALNRFLADEERRIDDIILDLQREGIEISFDKIKKRYSGNSHEYFKSYVDHIIELDRNRVKEKTIKNFHWRFAKIE